MYAMEAVIAAKASIREVLENSGCIIGDNLSQSQIETAIKPIFWENIVSNKAAASQSVYFTYKIVDVTPISWGDGKIQGRSVIANITANSNCNIDELLVKINKEFVEKEWMFEFSNQEYDSNTKMNVISFNIKAKLYLNEESED